MKLDRKFIAIVIGAIGLYAIFLLISDISTVSNQLSHFKIQYLPIVLILVPCGWLAVFLRWTLLLKQSGINIPLKKSLSIYLSGFALTVTPGKVGELIKSQLLKSRFDIPRTKTAPLVMVERLYDLVGAVSAAFFGIWALGVGSYIIIIAAISLCIIFLLISSRAIFDKFLKFFNKIKLVSKYLQPLSESYEVVRVSSRGKTAFFASSLSFADWMLEALAAYFILLGFGIDAVNYLNVASAFSASLILGAVSFIPGGIGVAEGSLVGLLSLQGITISSTFALVVIIRIFTLWYSVGVGFIALKLSGGLSLKSAE